LAVPGTDALEDRPRALPRALVEESDPIELEASRALGDLLLIAQVCEDDDDRYAWAESRPVGCAQSTRLAVPCSLPAISRPSLLRRDSTRNKVV
jgi:hypothetical protein